MYGDDILIGKKTRLTAISRDDLPTFLTWMQSIEIRRMLAQGHIAPLTMEDQIAWYERVNQNPAERPLAIRTLEDNTLIGNCGLMDFNYTARRCMIGIVIGEKAYWGKGYGSDAMNVMLRYAFNEVNMHRVGLEVYSYNKRAIRAYEKLGFVLEGTLRETLLRDGEWHHIHHMGILRREWLARNGGE